MTQSELQQRINVIKAAIREDMAKAPNRTEERVAELFLSGCDLLGDLLLDIKRIADAAERSKP